MTPQMKKALTALKKLNSYELASLNTEKYRGGDAVLSIITALDQHLVENTKGLFGLSSEEFMLLKSGKKIQAIQAVRERTALGLADAKHKVDEAQAQLGMRQLQNTSI